MLLVMTDSDRSTSLDAIGQIPRLTQRHQQAG
jgi:hypothetical protein